MRAEDAELLGYVERVNGGCGAGWKASRVLRDADVYLEFRTIRGAPSIQSITAEADSNFPSPVSTTTGVRIGTSEHDLKVKYPGEALHHSTFPAEDGQYEALTTFGPDGALMFILSPGGQLGEPGVIAISAVPGTSMKTLKPPGLAC